MAKEKSFGFKTPIRRSTKNITGNKVGGDLTGGECKIIRSHKLIIDQDTSYSYLVSPSNAVGLFNSNIGIVAIGGYFIPDNDVTICLRISINDKISEQKYNLKKNKFYALGHDYEIELETNDIEDISIEIEFKTIKTTSIEYTHFSFGFVDKKEFRDNENIYRHYSNSKKKICFPEQFYFLEEYIIEGSTKGQYIIVKSCNRCQRYLPINPYNQRTQLAFSNHCTTKAPCTHKSFSNYMITNNLEQVDYDIKDLVNNNFEKGYEVNSDGNIISYYGHQLECKACKKFFVNAALNHLRTSTQHREDSLRRRAFEVLSRKLLNLKWIYHEYRLRTGKEFDKEIWLKFNKKCFNCGKEIKSAKEMNLDHTMPLSHLYPLDETATCLCATCNNAKSDIFPVDFYDEKQLEKLSIITGIPLALLMSHKSNQKVVDLIHKNIIWVVEDFLTHPDYLQIRDEKKAADSILHSINKAISRSDTPFDVLEEYEKAKSIHY